MYSAVKPSSISVEITTTATAVSTESTIAQESYHRKVAKARSSASSQDVFETMHDSVEPSSDNQATLDLPTVNEEDAIGPDSASSS